MVSHTSNKSSTIPFGTNLGFHLDMGLVNITENWKQKTFSLFIVYLFCITAIHKTLQQD